MEVEAQFEEAGQVALGRGPEAKGPAGDVDGRSSGEPDLVGGVHQFKPKLRTQARGNREDLRDGRAPVLLVRRADIREAERKQPQREWILRLNRPGGGEVQPLLGVETLSGRSDVEFRRTAGGLLGIPVRNAGTGHRGGIGVVFSAADQEIAGAVDVRGDLLAAADGSVPGRREVELARKVDIRCRLLHRVGRGRMGAIKVLDFHEGDALQCLRGGLVGQEEEALSELFGTLHLEGAVAKAADKMDVSRQRREHQRLAGDGGDMQCNDDGLPVTRRLLLLDRGPIAAPPSPRKRNHDLV